MAGYLEMYSGKSISRYYRINIDFVVGLLLIITIIYSYWDNNIYYYSCILYVLSITIYIIFLQNNKESNYWIRIIIFIGFLSQFSGYKEDFILMSALPNACDMNYVEQYIILKRDQTIGSTLAILATLTILYSSPITNPLKYMFIVIVISAIFQILISMMISNNIILQI